MREAGCTESLFACNRPKWNWRTDSPFYGLLSLLVDLWEKFTFKSSEMSTMLLTYQNHWDSSHNKIFAGKPPKHIKYREAILSLTFHNL